MKLFFREVGDGPPVVILHGLFGSSDNWQSFARELAPMGYRVVTADLRNHGHSPHDTQFDFKVMSADVSELINESCGGKAYLIGHSLGGKVAMQLSLDYPELLTGLTVIDIAPRYYPPHHQLILEALHSFDPSVIASRGEAEKFLSEKIDEPGVRQFLLKNLYWKEKDKLGWRFNLEDINTNIENVGEEIKTATPSAVRTLFVAGVNSNYITETDHPDIKAIYPDAKILIAPDAGHWVHADNPKWLLNAVAAHISG